MKVIDGFASLLDSSFTSNYPVLLSRRRKKYGPLLSLSRHETDVSQAKHQSTPAYDLAAVTLIDDRHVCDNALCPSRKTDWFYLLLWSKLQEQLGMGGTTESDRFGTFPVFLCSISLPWNQNG